MTTWPFSYSPGTLVGFATADLVALVDLPTDDELVARIATVVAGEAPTLDAVLDILVSRGLRSVDTFGLAARTGRGLRVLVRGACRAVADDHCAESAEGLWAESVWEGVTQAQLVTEDAGARSLPLAGGVVLASALGFGTPGVAVPEASAPVAAPDPDEQPGEAPEGDVADDPDDLAGEPAEPAEPVAEPATEPSAEPVALEDPDLVLAVAPDYDTHLDAIPPEPAAPSEPTPEPAHATLASPLTGPPPGAEGEPTDDDPADKADPEPLAVPAASDGFIAAMPWSLEDAFAAPPAPAPPAEVADAGHTVDGPALRAAQAAQAGREPLVVAVLCPQDHPNPVHATACRVCGQPLSAQQPVEVPRPSLGVLKLANGDVVALERGAVLGRNPRLPQGWTGEQPHLVRIDDPERDVSGQHLEVRLDAWHVLVRDLGSTNGTEVALPGSEPVLLRAHEQLSIEPGTRIVLAGVFEVTYMAGA